MRRAASGSRGPGRSPGGERDPAGTEAGAPAVGGGGGVSLRALVVLVLDVAITLVLAATATVLLLVPGTVPLVDRTIVPLWATLVLETAGVRFSVERLAPVPPGPVVFMVNHRSHFDIPVLWLALERPFRFVAKRELVAIPFFGWALKLLGHVILDRGDSAAAHATMARAVERVRGGVSVLVFPEGTRAEPAMLAREPLGSFKKGGVILAIQAGVPIVPVAIAGTERILPKRTMAIRGGAVRVMIGRPIETAGLTEADRNRLTAEARAAVAALLDQARAAAAGARI